MVNKKKLEDRIIPYKMLLKAISTTKELVERILPESGIPSLRIGLNEIEKVLERNIEKAREGLPIVGYHFALPAEFLSLYDCVPVCIEGTSYFLSTLLLNGVEKYYDLIGSWGHPYHTCTSQKGTMGMTLDDLFQFDVIITPTAPCDSTCASYPFFKYEKNIPLIIADMPYKHNEESFNYYKEQLRDSLYEVGEIIGQEPNFKKLRDTIELENKVLHTKLEIFELLKAKPSPLDSIYNAISAGATVFIAGEQEDLSFYEHILNLAKRRYKNSEHHGGEEKIRSIWPYMITFFDISLCEWLDRELQLSILFDIFNYNFSDPIDTKSDKDSMFYGMARKSMEFPMVKQSTDFYYQFLEDCVNFAKDYDADCFIYTQSLACKQFGSVPKILREALKEELGIPMLIIEYDTGDARMTSLNKFKEKITNFVQTLL
ncbi:MAG: hypothetical protein BAJALOKI2v1_910010 [Promethearchaeota archaeon]|nr:MAG: hypothetical protein BAJALOKI2v1_910010 [Candidatus Lokiarchaeota archaeon]